MSEKKLSPENFKTIVKTINSICVKQIDTDDTMSIYYHLLNDLSYEEILAGVVFLAKTKENNYSPFSPAEIRNAAKKEENAELSLFVDSIFDQIRLDIIKYPPEKRPKYLAVVNKALERIGGIGAIGSAEEKELFFIKREFKKEITENTGTEEIRNCMLEVKKNKQLLLKK